MKFIVEIDDFWLDEEDLQSGLTNYVKNDVLSQINKSIKEKIENAITLEVKKQVEKSMYTKIQRVVSKVIKNEKVKSRHSNTGEITLEEYIKEDFLYNSGYSSPSETIKKLAKKFGEEFKERYDLLFASQVVAKLGESGLLKRDAAKMLLEINDKK